MAKPYFDRELASRVLALAARAGDEEAAKHFGISVRSVKRYRARMAADGQLLEAVQKNTAELDAHAQGWASEAAGFMVIAIRKLGQLVGQAGPKQMRDVVGAVKIVGELDITRKVLGGDEQPGAGAEGSAAPAHARVAAEKEASSTEDDRVH